MARRSKTSQETSGTCKRDFQKARNITIAGRRTSVRLEPEMWDALEDVSRREKLTIHDLCTRINQRRVSSNATYRDVPLTLSAAIRVFLIKYFRECALAGGFLGAGQGVVLIEDVFRNAPPEPTNSGGPAAPAVCDPPWPVPDYPGIPAASPAPAAGSHLRKVARILMPAIIKKGD